MTKRECAIVSAYTGLLCGEFSWMHEYTEEKFGRPVWTHEFGDKKFALELKKKSKEDFCSLHLHKRK